MRTTAHKLPSALRHGIYSTLAVLPGEDQAAFDKLRREVIAEYSPKGPTENYLVAMIVGLIWRWQNLSTLRIARRADNYRSSVLKDMLAAKFPEQTRTHPESEKIVRAAEDQVRKELGEAYDLVELGEAASFDGLANELDLEERLASAIERYVKRLLLVRGIKSLSGATSSVPVKQIAGPSKAA